MNKQPFLNSASIVVYTTSILSHQTHIDETSRQNTVYTDVSRDILETEYFWITTIVEIVRNVSEYSIYPLKIWYLTNVLTPYYEVEI